MRKENKAQLAIAITQDIAELFPVTVLKQSRRYPDSKLLQVSYNDMVQFAIRFFMVGKAWTG